MGRSRCGQEQGSRHLKTKVSCSTSNRITGRVISPSAPCKSACLMQNMHEAPKELLWKHLWRSETTHEEYVQKRNGTHSYAPSPILSLFDAKINLSLSSCVVPIHNFFSLLCSTEYCAHEQCSCTQKMGCVNLATSLKVSSMHHVNACLQFLDGFCCHLVTRCDRDVAMMYLFLHVFLRGGQILHFAARSIGHTHTHVIDALSCKRVLPLKDSFL